MIKVINAIKKLLKRFKAWLYNLPEEHIVTVTVKGLDFPTELNTVEFDGVFDLEVLDRLMSDMKEATDRLREGGVTVSKVILTYTEEKDERSNV